MILKNVRPNIIVAVFSVVLCSALALLIFNLFRTYSLSWDEAVYLKSAEYLYTGGRTGLLENLRPLGLSIVLIPMYLLGINPIFFGRILNLLAVVLILYLFYKIYLQLVKTFNLKSKFLKPVIIILLVNLLLFPEFFKAALGIRPEIFAMLFFLAGFYLFLSQYNKRFSKIRIMSSGIFFCFAFYTRFTYGIFIIAILILFLIDNKKSKLFWFFLGYALIITLMSILHLILYPEQGLWASFYPFIEQFNAHRTTYVWYYQQPGFYYVTGLLQWNLLTISILPGIYMLFKAKMNIKPKLLAIYMALSSLCIMILLSASPHKEFRYIMLLLPFILFFASIPWLLSNQMPNGVLGIIILYLLFIAYSNIVVGIDFMDYARTDRMYEFNRQLENLTTDNIVLTSSPLIVTGGKIEIGYYDDYYFYNKLLLKKYDYVYYFNSSFPCNDEKCYMILNLTHDLLNTHYDLRAEHGTGARIFSLKT